MSKPPRLERKPILHLFDEDGRLDRKAVYPLAYLAAELIRLYDRRGCIDQSDVEILIGGTLFTNEPVAKAVRRYNRHMDRVIKAASR